MGWRGGTEPQARMDGFGVTGRAVTPTRSPRPAKIRRRRYDPSSPGARRTRQWRARLREGRVCFRIELSRLAIDGLVELRWLHPSRRDDPAAVCEGFRRFLGVALDMTRNR